MKTTAYRTARPGYQWVVTAYGYRMTPDTVKPERSIGQPVPGFENCIPSGWAGKSYVVEKRIGARLIGSFVCDDWDEDAIDERAAEELEQEWRENRVAAWRVTYGDLSGLEVRFSGETEFRTLTLLNTDADAHLWEIWA